MIILSLFKKIEKTTKAESDVNLLARLILFGFIFIYKGIQVKQLSN
jgi:hypothetical protein